METPVAIWLILTSLTLLSFTLVEGGWLGAVSTAVIVAIATMKSALVIDHYMEARHAPPRWRILYKLWNFTAAAIIVVGQLLSAGPSS